MIGYGSLLDFTSDRGHDSRLTYCPTCSLLLLEDEVPLAMSSMWSVESVKRQISTIKSKCTSPDEYKSQGYTLARLCLKGGLRNDALLHLREYVSVKPRDYRAHNMMGDIYNDMNQPQISLACYNRSIQLKPSQRDVLNKLAQIYCESVDASIEDMEATVARIQSVNRNDPFINKLKEKILMKGGVVSFDEEDHEVPSSLQRSSKIGMIRQLIKNNKVDEAYEVCQRLYRHSNWNDFTDQSHLLVLTVYKEYLNTLKQSGVPSERVISIQFRFMEFLCMSHDIDLRAVCHASYGLSKPLTVLIQRFDSCLHDMSISLSSMMASQQPLVKLKYKELIGQLYYQISQCLFACHSTNYQYWQLGVVCGVCSLNQPSINESNGNHLSQVDRSDFECWVTMSQSRYTVLASQLKLISLQDGTASIEKALHLFSTPDFKQAALKMIFGDTAHDSVQYSVVESFIAKDDRLLNPDALLSGISPLLQLPLAPSLHFITSYQSDLCTIVWMCTILIALDNTIPYHEWVSRLFPSLPLSPVRLSVRATPTSLSQCDIEAFLIIAICRHELMGIKQATPTHSMISGCVVSPQFKVPNDLLIMWNAFQSLNKSDLSATEAIANQKSVTVALELIRACNPVTLSSNELIVLARHFKRKADENTTVQESFKVLSDWSCHYWRALLDLSSSIRVPTDESTVPFTRRSTESPRKPVNFPRLFSRFNKSSDNVSDAIINEAVMCIASQYAVTSGSEDKALILYDQLTTYQAAYNTSQIYVSLSEGNEPVLSLRFLEKALKSIAIAKSRAEDINNEKAVAVIEQQQKKLKTLMANYRSTVSCNTLDSTPSRQMVFNNMVRDRVQLHASPLLRMTLPPNVGITLPLNVGMTPPLVNKEWKERLNEEKVGEKKEHTSATPTSIGSLEDNVIFIMEELPSHDLIKKAESLLLPKSFYNYLSKPACPGCIGCEDGEIVKQIDQQVPSSQETTPTSQTPPTEPKSANDVSIVQFGNSSGLLSFADLSANSSSQGFNNREGSFTFLGKGQQIFKSPTQDEGAGDNGYNPEDEINISFKPIVTLPETYTYQTDEEEEQEVLFDMRGKLFRYDVKTGQWKERGVGNMKVIHYLGLEKYRLIMRRDQIHKICCNHYLTPDMEISHHLGQPNALMWTTLSDYTENTPRPEKLALKFGKPATATLFKELFEEFIGKLKTETKSDECSDDNGDDNN